MTLTEQIRSLYNEIVETRRYFHMHPELSHQEIATPAFIADRLEELGLKFRRGVGQYCACFGQ